ncbi:hypothetical protein MOP88_17730 [Sphingomonas sp. WKB10]|nr:hypothetical protein [Sphingomonas sp. WKB10]
MLSHLFSGISSRAGQASSQSGSLRFSLPFQSISLLATVAVGSFVSTFSAILIVSAVVLNGIAVVMLFKPDAKEWLGEGRDPDDIEAPRV